MSKGRLVAALAVILFSVVAYLSNSEINPVTGEKQYLALSRDQEIALGLESAPAMAQQFGGLDTDADAQARVDKVGLRLIRQSDAGAQEWQYNFNLLADDQTVNAFALPGGQIFITRALYDQLQSDDQLAGVLGHEIGHVIARHSAQQIAKQQLASGVSGAAVVATGDYSAGQLAQVAGQFATMKYGRDDELESDHLGLRFMSQAGYNVNAMVEVMQILQQASGGASGPEFAQTHPNPENRIKRLRDAIASRDYLS